jgi:hypothetical protein
MCISRRRSELKFRAQRVCCICRSPPRKKKILFLPSDLTLWTSFHLVSGSSTSSHKSLPVCGCLRVALSLSFSLSLSISLSLSLSLPFLFSHSLTGYGPTFPLLGSLASAELLIAGSHTWVTTRKPMKNTHQPSDVKCPC